MARIVEDVAQLSENIGPRPAGTEEEQQVALYIADELQKGAGFSTVIEDFNCLSSATIVRTICFAVGFVAALLPLFLPVIAVPAFILGIAAAVIYVLEITGKEIISRFFHTGVSQNVVAKYVPAGTQESPRSRKIILVANYDSDKEDKKFQTPLAKYMGKIRLAVLIGLAAAPVVLLIKTVFFLNAVGGIVIFFNILTVICLILMALPLVDVIVRKISSYNQGANNNAAGIGVLLETARTIGNGLTDESELDALASEEGTVIHGEEAARSAGVMPEGVEVEYETSQRNLSPEESLAAAKAAIAALTGKPVADKVPVTDISSRLVKVGEPADAASASVHFEVDENVGKQPIRSAKSSRPTSRTFVYKDEPETSSEKTSDSKEEVVEQKAQSPAEKVAAEAAAVAAAEAAAKAAKAATAVTPTPQASQVAPTASFTRETPEALRSGQTGSSTKVDKTPAWARSAQAKAHANRPELEINKKVSRSRFADTVAAQLTDASLAASGAINQLTGGAIEAPVSIADSAPGQTGDVSRETVQPEKPMTELEARLAALHSEIAATEAPHLSDEAKAAFERMGEPEQQKEKGMQPAQVDEVSDLGVEGAALNVAPVKPVPEPEPKPKQANLGSTAPIEPVSVAQSGKEITPPVVVSVTDIAKEEDHNLAQAPSTSAAAASTARSGSAKSLGAVTKKASDTQKPERVTVEVTPVSSGNKEEASTTGKTQAIAPIDVSALLNKDQEKTPETQKASGKPKAADVPVTKRASDTQKPEVQKTSVLPSASVDQAASVQTKSDQQKQLSNRPVPLVQDKAPQNVAKASPSQERVQVPASEAASIASPIIGMDSIATLQSEAIPRVDIDTLQPAQQAERQVIVLPDVVSAPNASLDEGKQRAPMAEGNESTRSGTKALLSNMLPRISENGVPVHEESSNVDTFGLNLPSLGDSGEVEHNTVSPTGSFSTVGGTGAFAPVGDELVADVAPEDMYVDDADDSAYDQEYTQTGAFAGPGYVDMPKSRAGRLFGRFRSKKKKDQVEPSMREWINADDNYEARSVGKARGNWESFREDDASVDAPVDKGQFVDVDYSDDSFDNPRGWSGGAFSLKRLRKGKADAEESLENYGEEFYEEYAEDFDADYITTSSAENYSKAASVNQEFRKLNNFRYPGLDTEVWFVALGAENAAHSGMQAFMDEHADELKGSIIINLEALGAGRLTFIEREGFLKPKAVSSRMKRFLRAASEKTGISFSTATMDSRDTTAQYAMSRGHQAMTIMGMEQGQAAHYGSKDDTIDNIDEQTLEANAAFVMAILKSM